MFDDKPLAGLGYQQVYRVKVIQPKSAGEARNIQKSPSLVVAYAGSSDIARALFENKNINIIIGLESSPKEDPTHYRNSGLNQILCKLAAKNKIAVGFDLRQLKSQKKEKIMGRMMQNLRLCRKYHVPVVIASLAENVFQMNGATNMESYARMLGMTPQEIKAAFSFASLLEEKKVKKPAKGVRIL